MPTFTPTADRCTKPAGAAPVSSVGARGDPRLCAESCSGPHMGPYTTPRAKSGAKWPIEHATLFCCSRAT
eukprot:6448885-Alexandrium_andersonii.AAC.1